MLINTQDYFNSVSEWSVSIERMFYRKNIKLIQKRARCARGIGMLDV